MGRHQELLIIKGQRLYRDFRSEFEFRIKRQRRHGLQQSTTGACGICLMGSAEFEKPRGKELGVTRVLSMRDRLVPSPYPSDKIAITIS